MKRAWQAAFMYSCSLCGLLQVTPQLLSTVCAGLVVASVRTLNLRSLKSTAPVCIAGLGGLAFHIHHMLYVKFDYDWNVKVRDF